MYCFVRCEQYMQYCRSRVERKLVFFDHEGKEIPQIIHAFPCQSVEVAELLMKEQRHMPFKVVCPPKGWYIYALNFSVVELFVMGYPAQSPVPERFNAKRHGGHIGPVEIWDDGCVVCSHRGVIMPYQVVFSPTRVSFVRGHINKDCVRQSKRGSRRGNAAVRR